MGVLGEAVVSGEARMVLPAHWPRLPDRGSALIGVDFGAVGLHTPGALSMYLPRVDPIFRFVLLERDRERGREAALRIMTSSFKKIRMRSRMFASPTRCAVVREPLMAPPCVSDL